MKYFKSNLGFVVDGCYLSFYLSFYTCLLKLLNILKDDKIIFNTVFYYY